MNNIKYNRIFLILSFFISLFLVVIIFNGFQSLKSMITNDFNAFLYLLAFIALFLILLVNLFISLKFINKSYKDSLKESRNNQVKTTKKIVKEDVKINIIDVQKLIQTTIPKKEKSINLFAEKFLINISKELEIVQGMFYNWNDEKKYFEFIAEYAFFGEEKPAPFAIGDTIPGQVAKNQISLNLEDIPEGYVTVLSGLGKSSPKNLLIVPVIHNNETIAIFELASFKKFDKTKIEALEKVANQLVDSILTFKGKSNT